MIGYFLYLHFFFSFSFGFVFRDRVSLYSPGCPGTHFVDHAGLELRNPPASASKCWSFQKGNITQKGSRDGKPSQKPLSHLSWGAGPPRGPRLPGRVIAAVTAEPWEFRASRRLRAATSRVRPAVIELRQHGSLSPGYLRSLICAASECGV